MCHNNPNWIETLPVVLLGLQTSFKENIKASAAELVYGMSLHLPGEFFLNEESTTDPQTFIKRFRESMREIRARPVARHDKRKVFVHKTLYSCTHIFVRVDAVKKPLEPPYEGRFEIIKRITDTIFKIDVKGRRTNISTERLKPAFFEAETTGEPDARNSAQTAIKTYVKPKKTGSIPKKTDVIPKKIDVIPKKINVITKNLLHLKNR
ncbi:uncharacterized protein LOC105197925 [Solenopsis invicta]|uniref:uncharacterized protein LOC105197925 n=1 Tax=Solenopsis invicta TaxID=13686 RepID=UPI000595956F|nr:uncharacterized protein LOC105197925 [Solenopsis invicta]